MKSDKAVATEPLTVTIQEAQRLTGESRSSIYNHIAAGEYEARKSGERVLIIFDSIKRHLAGLPPANIKASSRPKRSE
jgi:hypothetical protein